MVKKQYYKNNPNNLWQYFVKDFRCPVCEGNVYHHEYDNQNINCVCNSCNSIIATIKPEYIDEYLKKGIWK